MLKMIESKTIIDAPTKKRDTQKWIELELAKLLS